MVRDQPASKINSSIKDTAEDDKARQSMITGMSRYFVPISSIEKKKAREAYYFYINMQKVMVDTWEDADGHAPKGSPDAKEDKYNP